jgi:hypothetical protein
MGRGGASFVVYLKLPHLFKRFEFGAYDGVMPLRKEAFGTQAVGLAPKLNERLLKSPSLGGLQLASEQLLKSEGLVAFAERTLQPEELGVLEALVAFFQKTAVLVATDFIDRLVEVLGDMKTVVHDFGLRGGLAGGGGEAGPHVHSGRLDFFALGLRQTLPHDHRRLGRALRHHFKHPGRLMVGHQRNVAVATAKTLLIEADAGDLLGGASGKSSRHRAVHDPLHTVPIQSQQLGGLGERGTGQEHLDGKGFKHQRETRTRLGPRRHQRDHLVFIARATRQTGPGSAW